jgi:hypothetical protein
MYITARVGSAIWHIPSSRFVIPSRPRAIQGQAGYARDVTVGTGVDLLNIYSFPPIFLILFSQVIVILDAAKWAALAHPVKAIERNFVVPTALASLPGRWT